MKKITIILSVFALIAVNNGQTLYAQFKIPKGFLEKYDLKRICIDFDGDGKKDTTTIIIQNKSYNGLLFNEAFLIYLTSNNKNHIVEFGEGVSHSFDIKVKNNVIEFGYMFAGTGTFGRILKLRYNHTNNKIQLIGYDSNFRIYYAMGGRCEKSYNLLTGDYIVTNRFNVLTNNDDFNTVERKKVHKGNIKIKAVFIEDINDKLLEKLDLIGNKFEL